MNLRFISRQIDGVFLTLIFDEKNDLVFISSWKNFVDDVGKKFKNSSFAPYLSDQKSDLVFKQFKNYFLKKTTDFNFAYKLIGTTFQLKVWKALSDLKYGEIVSYSEIAQRINQPKAVRAVANAIASNPLLIVVPCHRVNGKNNSLTGFRSGLELKQKLQILEQK